MVYNTTSIPYQPSDINATLFRLTECLPKHELKLIYQEATDCEIALLKEIRELQSSAGILSNTYREMTDLETTVISIDESTQRSNRNPTLPLIRIPLAYDPTSHGPNYLESTEDMLITDFTPPDRYSTLSALLGRLRDPYDIPPRPYSAIARYRYAATIAAKQRQTSNRKKNPHTVHATDVEQRQRVRERQELLCKLVTKKCYTESQSDVTKLLALWKRISNHRTATVFRKAVQTNEAPGYADRISFPMDLGLIRKMIVAGFITSYQEMHKKMGLICHNCVKFNGRESDYGILTREFERYLDDCFLNVVEKLEKLG